MEYSIRAVSQASKNLLPVQNLNMAPTRCANPQLAHQRPKRLRPRIQDGRGSKSGSWSRYRVETCIAFRLSYKLANRQSRNSYSMIHPLGSLAVLKKRS